MNELMTALKDRVVGMTSSDLRVFTQKVNGFQFAQILDPMLLAIINDELKKRPA